MQLCKEGADEALSGLQCIVYQEGNVVLDGFVEWAAWLRSQYEKPVMIGTRATGPPDDDQFGL